MVMGYVDKELVLDSSMLKFVEPLGPAQVVDRQSLVILPQGYLKVSFETQARRLVLRVHAFREQLATRDTETLRTTIRTFYSIRNHVLEGKPSTGTFTDKDPELEHVFDKSVMERLAFGEQGFKSGQFREIMQLCIYRGRNRAFVGLVHVAVDKLFSQACEGEVTHGWYKIFPRSSFSVGCPIACITPHCVNPCPEKPEGIVYSSRMSKHATCPANLNASEKTQAPTETNNKMATAAKLTAYSRVVSVCRTLSRRVQMRRPQQQAPPLPVTIDLKVPEVSPSSTSSSSIDIGYGSGGSSHSAIPSPRLLGTSLDTATSTSTLKDFGVFRRKSMLSGSGRSSMKRYRRSFNFGDTLGFNQSNSKPTSTIRRSEEVISKQAAEFSSNEDQSTSGSSCSSSQQRIGFYESDSQIFLRRSVESNASEEASTSLDNFDDECEIRSRAKTPPMRSISFGGVAASAVAHHNTIARTSATAQGSIKAPRKQSFKRIARVLSRKRKERGNSTVSDGGVKDKKRPPVKASLSFPPNNCANEEPDNVYEVLLSLKKMSVSEKAPSVTHQGEESSPAAPAVAEITVECPPEDQDLCKDMHESTSTAAESIVNNNNNNNPCPKHCTKRGNFKQRRLVRLPNDAFSDSYHTNTKSLSDINRQRLCSKVSLSVQETSFCGSEDEEDEYVLCNESFVTVFSSNASSYVSLEEQAEC